MSSRLGLALLLTGQVTFTQCSQPELIDLIHSNGSAIANEPEVAQFAPGKSTYGVDGTISQKQLAILQGLAWPQTYDDMKGSFGFPVHRTETADYYQISGNSGKWAVILYNGKTATGFRVEEKK